MADLNCFGEEEWSAYDGAVYGPDNEEPKIAYMNNDIDYWVLIVDGDGLFAEKYGDDGSSETWERSTEDMELMKAIVKQITIDNIHDILQDIGANLVSILSTEEL